MEIVRAMRRAIRRQSRVGGALVLAVIVAGCSILQRPRVSFAGPLIEGTRAFTLVGPDGSDPERLFGGIQGLQETLAWSPSGDQVIVERDQGEFYVADPSAGSLGPCLTCGLQGALTAYFSPDGDQAAIGSDGGLYLVGADGTNLRQVADLPIPRWIDWSPDGTQIAFASRPNAREHGPIGVYILDVATGSVADLTGGAGGEEVEYFSPRWSPDGSLLAFHSLDDDGFHIVVIRPDGEGMREVTDWAFQGEIFYYDVAWPPQWSPNGEQLAFFSFDRPGVDFDADIFVVSADGSGRTNLTRHPAFDGDPTWSPDGRYIAFVSNRDGNGEIYVMKADGSDPINVSNSPTDEVNPAWRP